MRMELIAMPGETMSIADIDGRLEELNQEFQCLFAEARKNGGFGEYTDKFKQITDETAALKEKRASILERQNSDSAASKRIDDAIQILNAGSPDITEWDESVIRQLVDTVKVLSDSKICVYLRGGITVEQNFVNELR